MIRYGEIESEKRREKISLVQLYGTLSMHCTLISTKQVQFFPPQLCGNERETNLIAPDSKYMP